MNYFQIIGSTKSDSSLLLLFLCIDFSKRDLPVVFKEYFTKRSEIHDYRTRHVNDLNLTNNKKFFYDHAIRTSGTILWNSLSKTLKESKTIRHLRNQFRGSRMGHSVGVSVWCVTLLINTRFRFFILE